MKKIKVRTVKPRNPVAVSLRLFRRKVEHDKRRYERREKHKQANNPAEGM